MSPEGGAGARLRHAPHAGIGRRLARGSAVALGVYVAGAGLTYAAQLAIARLVGPQGFGIYAYVLAWCTVLAYVAALGFDVSMLRLVPGYLTQGRLDRLRGVSRYAQRRVGALGALIVALGITLVFALRDSANAPLGEAFVIGLPLVPVWALLWVRGAMVRGFGGVATALAPDRLVRDGTLLALTLAAVLLLGMRLDVADVMGMTLAGSLLGLLFVSMALRRAAPGAMRARTACYDDRRAWRLAALPLVTISVLESLQNRVGVLLLGLMGQTREAGVFALTFTLAMAVTLPRTAINALFAPMIAEIHARGDHAAMQFLVTRAAIWTLVSGLVIAVPLAMLADTVLAHFGPNFIAGRRALQTLLLGQVFAAAAGPQQFLMTMTGQERWAAALITGSVLLNATLGWLLIVPFGTDGAAAATTATMILWNLAMGLVVARRLHIVSGVLGLAATLPVS